MTNTPEEIMARGMFASDKIVPLLTHKQYGEYAKAAKVALEANGYAVVPKEPTDEMIDDGCNCMAPFAAPVAYRVWQAMITASQQETDS